MTSHDVVARLRRIAGTRKVGHAGTLDPMATGLLLLGLGRATRLLGHLALTEKAYDATIRLGESTTTDDAEGETLTVSSAEGLDQAAVRAAAARFVGELDQVPSSVSAVKIAGQRAYRRVRAGEQVDIPPRRVVVHELAVHGIREADALLDVDVSIRCSSGTYVRAIARDLGAGLGVGGHLTALRRTAVGPFGISEAHTLEQLEQSLDVLDIGAVARRCFPSRDISAEQATRVGHGQRLDLALDAAAPVALFGPTGDFVALYRQRGVVAEPVAVFAVEG